VARPLCTAEMLAATQPEDTAPLTDYPEMPILDLRTKIEHIDRMLMDNIREQQQQGACLCLAVPWSLTVSEAERAEGDDWRPVVMDRTPVPLRLVRAPAVRSTGHSASMTNGAPGHADTINSGPKWAASQANLRDHAVRLRNWRRHYCLRRSCEG
jgi:hypothetical protein